MRVPAPLQCEDFRRELVGDARGLEARRTDDFRRKNFSRRFLGGFVDGRRRAGADLRAEVVERGEGRLPARLFYERRALHDGYRFRSRLN